MSFLISAALAVASFTLGFFACALLSARSDDK